MIKKFGITEAEFERIMRQPPRTHEAYRSDERLFEIWRWARERGRRLVGRG